MNTEELVALYSSAGSVPPHPALDRLDDLDWSAVSDAYGSGTKVPALLRALNAPEPTHRSYANQALFECIWHQGTIYSATALAVPVLFQMLVSDETRDTPPVAVLLAAIADGEPPFARCEDDPEEAALWREILEKQGRSLDAEMAEGRAYADEIRRDMVSHMDSLYPFIRNPDPEVRMSVVAALGRFPEIVARVIADLRNALEGESDVHVRKAMQEVINRGSKQ